MFKHLAQWLTCDKLIFHQCCHQMCTNICKQSPYQIISFNFLFIWTEATPLNINKTFIIKTLPCNRARFNSILMEKKNKCPSEWNGKIMKLLHWYSWKMEYNTAMRTNYYWQQVGWIVHTEWESHNKVHTVQFYSYIKYKSRQS